MPLLKENIHTIEDIYALPDGQRAELIEGQIYMMAPPSTVHQEIAGAIYSAIREYIRRQKGNCRPFIAPFAVFLNRDENTYVEPDIIVVCDKEKLDEKGCHGAPDMVVEVVSPGSKKTDYYTKLVLYRDAGVRDYWIVDPSRGTVLVYHMEENDAPVIYQFSDMIPVRVIDGLSLTIKSLLDE